MTAQETKAREMIAGRTTESIVEMFEMTETQNTEEVPTVRGWLMDELEKRDEEAFDKWIDSEEASPRSFYL